MSTAPKVFFRGLNGLRFFAAFIVVIAHAETIRRKNGLFHLLDILYFNSGALAVQFFFVLSGFLITYLLLGEYAKTNTISIKNFYIRRTLRIWPLYYLLMVVGLFFLPNIVFPLLHINYELPYPVSTAALLYTFFLPNVVTAIYPSSFLYPLWSIGVEEQFYLIWAPVVKFFKQKNLPAICVGVIIFKLALSYFFHYLLAQNPSDTLAHISKFIDTLMFECMAIGALGAYYVFYNWEKMPNHSIFSLRYQILMFSLLFLILFGCKPLGEGTGTFASIYQIFFTNTIANVFFGIIFLYLILSVSLNPKSLIKTEGKVLNFLGEISYGIYMYHVLAIFVVITLFKKHMQVMNPITATLFYYVLISAIVITTSYLSYHFFERQFLKIKHRFE